MRHTSVVGQKSRYSSDVYLQTSSTADEQKILTFPRKRDYNEATDTCERTLRIRELDGE